MHRWLGLLPSLGRRPDADFVPGSKALELVEELADHPEPLLPKIRPGDIDPGLFQELLWACGPAPFQQMDQRIQKGRAFLLVFLEEGQRDELSENIAVAVEAGMDEMGAKDRLPPRC